jgi:hypothetical protein
VLAGQNANSISLNPVGLSDAGTYSVQVTGGAGSITNSALLALLSPTRLTIAISGGNLNLTWPAGYTGWRLQAHTGSLGANWSDVPGSAATNSWTGPINPAASATFYRLVYPSP